MKRLIGSRDVALSQVVRYRIRYFTDGAVLGGRGFVVQGRAFIVADFQIVIVPVRDIFPH